MIDRLMYAELSLEHRVLKDIIERKLRRPGNAAIWPSMQRRCTV